MSQKLIVAVLAAAAMATPAYAFNATSPTDVAALVNENGASAALKVGDDGKPWIDAQAGRTHFAVDFYECDEGEKACGTITYTAFWSAKKANLEHVNRWNRYTLRCPASLDKQGRVNGWMTAETAPELTRASFEAVHEAWLVCLSDLDDFANDPEAFLKSVEK
jgi:hypothetical protein